MTVSATPDRFWAKTLPNAMPGLSVLDHMLNVGQVALALA
jgi:5'-deoxynucleotidase YfbR-like HD superfamily hydrolase